MRNVLGDNLTLTIFGESHGSKIGAVIDGLSAGVRVDEEFIKECLSLRRPSSIGETKRVESDSFEIVSGVFNGYSTGSSICILIDNTNVKSKDYDAIKDLARPSHADYVANVKYNGFADYRGGGHFSGRITAAIVAAGAIILKALEKFDIKVLSHIKQIGDVKDRDFIDFIEDEKILSDNKFPTLDNVASLMQEKIEAVAKDNDSIGGIIQTAIVNLPVGLGEPMFSSLESKLSSALFSIGAVKGVEFGRGFDYVNYLGSQVNDEFTIKDNKVVTKTNNNGGINGGISNGMPVVFNCVIKPTPSIGKVQQTINMKSLQEETILVSGRHDPCIVRRANIVIKAISAFVIADAIISQYGANAFNKEKLD